MILKYSNKSSDPRLELNSYFWLDMLEIRKGVSYICMWNITQDSVIRQTKWHKSLDYRNILPKLTCSMIAPEKKTVQVTEGTDLNNDWVAYAKSSTVEDCRLLWGYRVP